MATRVGFAKSCKAYPGLFLCVWVFCVGPAMTGGIFFRIFRIFRQFRGETGKTGETGNAGYSGYSGCSVFPVILVFPGVPANSGVLFFPGDLFFLAIPVGLGFRGQRWLFGQGASLATAAASAAATSMPALIYIIM